MLASTHPSRFDHDALASELLARKPVLAAKIARACALEPAAVSALLLEVLRFLNLAAYAREHLGHSLTPSAEVDAASETEVAGARSVHTSEATLTEETKGTRKGLWRMV